MEFKIKKLAFRDVQKIAETITLLDLDQKQVKEMFEALTGGGSTVDLSTKAKVDKYLKDNFGKEEIAEVKKTMNTHNKLVAYLKQHSAQSQGLNENIIGVITKLIGIVSAKFDVIVDFMDYFLVDVVKEDIYEFDGDETVDALKAVFLNPEFRSFFSRMFN